METPEIDKKKAAILGISALGSILVSYLVYRSVADDTDEAYNRQRKRERMLRSKSRQQARTSH